MNRIQSQSEVGRPPCSSNSSWPRILCYCVQGVGGLFFAMIDSIYNNEQVAVKVWKQILSANDLVYFNREVNIQKRLDHPNCLKLYGVTTNPQGYPVLVTELAETSLTKLTTGRDPRIPKLTAEQKYNFILEIADGIRYLHSLGYVHRDIKVRLKEDLSM